MKRGVFSSPSTAELGTPSNPHVAEGDDDRVAVKKVGDGIVEKQKRGQCPGTWNPADIIRGDKIYKLEV